MAKNEKLTENERETWHKYHKLGGHNLSRCPVDKFNENVHDSIEHETAKFQLYFSLRKQGHRVLTEAVDNKTKKRHDVVDLTTGEVYEIEITQRRSERHPKNINVRLVNYSGMCTEDSDINCVYRKKLGDLV